MASLQLAEFALELDNWIYGEEHALSSAGESTRCAQELAKLRAVLKDKSLDGPLFSPNISRNILAIGPEVLVRFRAGWSSWSSSLAC